jgi:hypothetical protein
VELAAGGRTGQRLEIHTRRREDHFFAASGEPGRSLERLLSLAAAHVRAGEELFLGVAPRMERAGGKRSVHYSRWAWLDLDRPEYLPRLRELIRRKPAHMIVESAGSGGLHAYWRLREPLPACTVTDAHGNVAVNPVSWREPDLPGGVTLYRDRRTGRLIEDPLSVIDWIERANMRLIHALGYLTTGDGELVHVADVQCRERSRVMRLAGSVNGKTGRFARIVQLDLRLPAYTPRTLFGDLADPPARAPAARPVRRGGPRRLGGSLDPYKLIPAAIYFPRLAGIDLPDRGNISCPCPSHQDEDPSCSVGAYGWRCHGCGARWSIYDLASALRGGPTNDLLASSTQDFLAAKQIVREAFGELQRPAPRRELPRPAA